MFKKNLITALKKLYTAFGGQEEVKNNAVDIIDKTADIIEEGSSGGGGAFVVDYVSTGDGNYTFSKTWSEIQTAEQSGKIVLLRLNHEGHIYISYCVEIYSQMGKNGMEYHITSITGASSQVISQARSYFSKSDNSYDFS